LQVEVLELLVHGAAGTVGTVRTKRPGGGDEVGDFVEIVLKGVVEIDQVFVHV
jgi:hypothetical protein